MNKSRVNINQNDSKMEQAYFSNIRSKIIKYLDNAKKEVVVAMAWFTSDELFKSLIDCINRQVHVELILLDNPINFMHYAPDFNELINSGGILRIVKAEHGFLHHKFCIIDNKIAITGSYNWTYYAETRNIENIIITDNKDVIDQYKQEFLKLVSQISKASESPKLDWSDLEECQYINFEELNYEIENIVKAQNLTQINIVKSSTTVTVENYQKNPISRWNIGIKQTVEKNNCDMEIIIPKGEALPYTSKKIETFNYLDNRKNVICTILCEKSGNKNLITEKAITEITAGYNEWELTITIQFSLLQNGDLYAEILCLETGKVLKIKSSNPNFVDYAK